MIEFLVDEWFDKFDRWHYKTEASKGLVLSINKYISEHPKTAVEEANKYIGRELSEAEKLRQAVADAAANIK